MSTTHETMVLGAETIQRRYSIMAFISSWLIHTSYIVLPGTFTSLGNRLEQTEGGRLAADTVNNIPLLPLAGICCLVGSVGLGYLWRTWCSNYVWLTRNIFL